MEKTTSRIAVVCHGDGDGIIGAAVVARNVGDAEIIITQPFLLDKLNLDAFDKVYVVDIAVNNKNPGMTLEFVEKYGGKIVFWADHHVGSKVLARLIGKKVIVDEAEPSCVSLLAHNSFDVPKEWLDAANASDRPIDFSPTVLSERYNKAFKAALVELQNGNKTIVEEIQLAFIKELATEEQSALITKYNDQYLVVMNNTKIAVESLGDFLPGVGITIANAKIDMTTLCTLGYKKYPIVVIQFNSVKGEPITLVATVRKDINLVEKFGLASGAPFRINLHGNHEDVKKMVAEKLININQ
jgi:hypothetical protein